MDVIVERCAGLDVHRDNVVATVRVPGSGRRHVGDADPDVQGDARRARGTRSVAGGGWREVWSGSRPRACTGRRCPGARGSVRVLASERAPLAQRSRAQDQRQGLGVDVQLVQPGLVRPSFVPPVEIRRLRDLPRLRRAQTNERARRPAARESPPGRRDRTHERRLAPYSKSPRDAQALLRASPIPSNSPSSPRARCARRSRSYAKRWRATSKEHHGSWSPSCSRTSTRSILRCGT